ncbi:TnsA endonuclease C-terminal domain-containing protein [Paraburkholderia terrae]|uniref:TnsA endonuclease C-terminal domain-containing protein n=1 Tax=Paraburkholderia terrae TaxID=311230 RepID=UPI00296B2965|nr:TnsA endonuclease C-terminal domain-containing protein [Paraburkholderia terrae]MDW3663784.1 TnsA endonuclease C-terminal domain-containing protein [Paraburkholderia terrae]
MTTRKLRIRKGTLKRKLKEQAIANDRGFHQRWQHTRDMPGSGIKTRLVCNKAASGELHLMSEAEHSEFLEGWYRQDVKVIYDQVALDREKTQRAAASINVPHPFYRHLDEPAVLSTSLVYVTERGGTHNREARSVRSISIGKEVEPTRSQLIERQTWEDDGASYSMVRANGMHARRSKNLAWIFRAHNDTVGRKLSDAEIAAQHKLLRFVRQHTEMRVIDACRLVDRTTELPTGSGARAFRQLTGAKKLAFDLDVSDPLNLRLGEVWRPKL